MYGLRFANDQVPSLGAKTLELRDHAIDFLVPNIDVLKLAPTDLAPSREAFEAARLWKHDRDFSAPLISNYEMFFFHWTWFVVTEHQWSVSRVRFCAPLAG